MLVNFWRKLKAFAPPRPLADTDERRQLQCSFCGKDAGHVRFLAAGVHGGMICDRCCLIALWIFVRAGFASALRLSS